MGKFQILNPGGTKPPCSSPSDAHGLVGNRRQQHKRRPHNEGKQMFCIPYGQIHKTNYAQACIRPDSNPCVVSVLAHS